MFVLPLSRTVHSNAHRAVAPQLTRALDRLFDESFDRYFDGASNGSRSPALEVTESDTAYTLAFDVPGATREQLKVSVEGRRVSVESIRVESAGVGSVPVESTNTEPAQVDGAPSPATDAAGAAPTEPQAAKPVSRVLYRERSAAGYARTVSLPAEVDQAASKAKFENGVLTLTLAKKVPTGATRLSIG